jgi:hypothetical protein
MCAKLSETLGDTDETWAKPLCAAVVCLICAIFSECRQVQFRSFFVYLRVMLDVFIQRFMMSLQNMRKSSQTWLNTIFWIGLTIWRSLSPTLVDTLLLFCPSHWMDWRYWLHSNVICVFTNYVPPVVKDWRTDTKNAHKQTYVYCETIWNKVRKAKELIVSLAIIVKHMFHTWQEQDVSFADPLIILGLLFLTFNENN